MHNHEAEYRSMQPWIVIHPCDAAVAYRGSIIIVERYIYTRTASSSVALRFVQGLHYGIYPVELLQLESTV